MYIRSYTSNVTSLYIYNQLQAVQLNINDAWCSKNLLTYLTKPWSFDIYRYMYFIDIFIYTNYSQNLPKLPPEQL